MAMEARLTPPDPAARHDPAAAAGDPAPAALHARAGGGRAEGARGEPAPRGGAGRDRGPAPRRRRPRRRGAPPEGPRRRAGAREETPDGRRAAPTTCPFDLSEVIFEPPRRAHARLQEEHEELPFENLVGDPDLAGRPPDRAAPAAVTDRRAASAHRRGDHRQPRRGRLPAGRRRGDRGEQRSRPGRGGREGAAPWCRASIPPAWRRATCASACCIQLGQPIAEPDPVSVEIVEQHFEDLQRCKYAEIARALKLPTGAGHGGGRGDPGARAQARPALRVVDDRGTSCPTSRPEGRRRLRRDPQRGRHPAAPGQLALPVAASRPGGRGASSTSSRSCAPRCG